jgi:ABC-type oligopeptide transport system substrate-binding subunit
MNRFQGPERVGQSCRRAWLEPLQRREFLRLAGAVAIGALLGGCSQLNALTEQATSRAVEDAPATADSRRGGTLVVGLATTSIVTLDPAAYSDRATETVVRNIFDGLVTRTTDNQIVPEIARDYRWLDETTIEFELKRGVLSVRLRVSSD